MKRLILHSDQLIPASFAMDRKIFEFIHERPIRMAYIASNTDPERKYFKIKRMYYERLGITDLKYFDFDREISNTQAKELAEFNAIHLAGGDTNYFLASLHRSGGLQLLKDFALAGKVLVGISAGAIITGRNIGITTLLNETVSSNSTGLSLMDFEFFPHYDYDDATRLKLQAYSKTRSNKIYACSDGNGIVVEGNKISFFGEVACFENGIVVDAVG